MTALAEPNANTKLIFKLIRLDMNIDVITGMGRWKYGSVSYTPEMAQAYYHYAFDCLICLVENKWT